MFYVITSEICCFAFARQMIQRSIVLCLFCRPPPPPPTPCRSRRCPRAVARCSWRWHWRSPWWRWPRRRRCAGESWWTPCSSCVKTGGSISVRTKSSFIFTTFIFACFLTTRTKCPLPPSLPPSLPPHCFVRTQTVWIADSPSVPPLLPPIYFSHAFALARR